MSDQPQTVPDLPQPGIISYFTTISTPTRVRRLASIGLKLTALLNAFAAVTSAALLGGIALSRLGRGWSFDSLVDDFGLLAIALGCGLAQWLLAHAVEGGSIRACQVVGPTLIPTVLGLWFLCLVPATFGVAALDNEIAITWRIPAVSLCVVWLLGEIVCSLLVVDLMRFISWIAAHPTTEKPPVPFLPQI